MQENKTEMNAAVLPFAGGCFDLPTRAPTALNSSSNSDACDANNSKQPNAKSKEDTLVEEGRCPSCGTQLYKVVQKKGGIGWGIGKKHKEVVSVMKPLTIKGKVQRGNCLQCHQKNKYDDDAVAAAAFASIPEVLPGICEDRSSNAATSTNAPSKKKSRKHNGKAIYIGDYNEYGNRSGHGELVWSNGDRYVGEFFNGKRHGKGTLYFRDGSEYIGEWECNHMHGKGTRRFANGDIYAGTYVDGKRSDIGKFYFANGDMYYGKWSNDKIHGFGRFYYSSGIAFEGVFKEGKRHGLGKLQRQNGELDIYIYDCNQRTYPGIRWSKDRTKAWKIMNGGKSLKSISIAEAVSMKYSFEAQHNGSIIAADIRQLEEQCQQLVITPPANYANASLNAAVLV